jgi:peptide deformylase
MIKELICDQALLKIKAEDATADDLPVARHLRDTLIANREDCAGISANMIGINKRIIAFVNVSEMVPTYDVMINPEIVSHSGEYVAREVCIAIGGKAHKCRRYKTVKVEYQDLSMNSCSRTFTGLTAQIIQHEIDHCNGVLI